MGQHQINNEAQKIRENLIKDGVIKPGKLHMERDRLIESGVITPLSDGGEPNYVELIDYKSRITPKESGEYHVKKMRFESEYLRKKSLYFRMIQEIIWSRQKCNLILGPKENNDPDWFF